MTLLGKILTLLNFALSVAILMIAITSFVNPVDFTNSAAKDGNPPGLYKQRADKVREAWEKIPPALAGLNAAKQSLAGIQVYNEAHAWFDQELSFLRSKGGPVQVVKYNSAVPELDQTDLKAPYKLKMEDGKDFSGQPLLSLDVYTDKGTQLAKDLKVQEDRYLKAVEEDTLLTSRRIDQPAKKGLNTRLVDEEYKLKQAEEEVKRIEPLLINAYVESELSIKRRGALEGRLEELRKLNKVDPPENGDK